MANKAQYHITRRILRGMADIQRASQAVPLTVSSISGVENPWLMLHPTASAITVCLTLYFLPIFYQFLFTTEKILDTFSPYSRDDISNDIDVAWDTIAAATADDRLQAINWDNWMQLF